MTESFEFELQGKTYRTEIATAGRIVDLWKMRTFLSGGQYGQMYTNGLIACDEALLCIDIQAFFMVFCPKFIDNMKLKSISDMGIKDYKELKKVYKNSIEKWIKETEALVRDENTNE